MRRPLKSAALLWFVMAALIATALPRALAQTADSLAEVHKLFVAPLQGDTNRSLHQDLAKHLRAEGRYELVSSPEQADAILSGTARLWVTGHVSVNPRNPSANAQPSYSGYLSVDLTGRQHEPLWSYLVVPSRFVFGGVSNNLAENAVKALLRARSELTSAYAVPSQTAGGAHIVLHGAGASFPEPLYRRWIAAYHELHPEIDITYDAVGSEAGTRMLAEGKLDFAASEIPASAETASQPSFPRIASVLGGVVPIYNLNGVEPYLKFTPETLAGVYLGRIVRWNDPAIQATNHGVHLPNAAILVVHRSDGSGTTYTWSEFLSRASDPWKAAVGTGATLHWPVGEGEALNEGVASSVASTPNSIGYVELVYAIQHQLSFGAVRNNAGVFVHADLGSLTATARSGNNSGQGAVTDASAKDAYPLAAFTWLLLPRDAIDAQKRTATQQFLEWVLTSGQRSCAALGYAPLPNDVAAREIEQLHRAQ